MSKKTSQYSEVGLEESDINEKRYHEKLSKHFLYPLFFPKNIAVVGASKSGKKGGITIYLNVYKECGYGIDKLPKIYPVNPKYVGELFYDCWRCYKDLYSIPEKLDIVLCAIKAPQVPNLLRECIDVEAKFLVIYTSGFSEVGGKGISYTNELKQILKESNYKTRIIGPNCFGPINSQIDLTFNRIVPYMYKGSFSFFSQSGGFAHRIIEYGENRGLGINLGLSVGNMIDVDMNDVLDFYMMDDKTKVIGFYLESVQNYEKGRKFFNKLKEIKNKKPIIIFKGGRTEIGAKSCTSHTGAIAGSYKIYKAVFKQTNVINVKNSEEFFDIAYLLTKIFPDKLPNGNNMCVIVPGGGSSVEMSDTFSEAGYYFPPISEHTQQELVKFLYDVNTNLKNPIDGGAYSHIPALLLKTIKLIAQEPQIDIIVAVSFVSRLTHGVFKSEDFPEYLSSNLKRINKKTNKLIVIIPIVDYDNDISIDLNKRLKKHLNKYNIPHFPSINRAARTFELLKEFLKKYNKNN